MPQNPYINALAASTYICGIVLLFRFLHDVRGNTPDSFLDPIGALSLLVFSVATMAFLFFYYPVVLLFEQKRTEAVTFFLKTLGTFGGITLLVFITLSLL